MQIFVEEDLESFDEVKMGDVSERDGNYPDTTQT